MVIDPGAPGSSSPGRSASARRARALEAADYHDGWLTVDKAVKGKLVSSPVRCTKTGKPKRLPVGEELADWIEQHVPRERRLRSAPLFANPRTGGRYAHKPLGEIWAKAVEAAGLPHVKLYEGTKHSFATDAIRRGVSERLLQRFLGHSSVVSTRRYARLADGALVEVLRARSEAWRQAGDKGSQDKDETPQDVTGGPSRIRTGPEETGFWRNIGKLDDCAPLEARSDGVNQAEFPPQSHHPDRLDRGIQKTGGALPRLAPPKRRAKQRTATPPSVPRRGERSGT